MHSEPKVTRENLGGWMVKCNPKSWDLVRFLADGHHVIDNWSVLENYRSALMQRDDLVFLWVTAGHPRVVSGLWSVGRVTSEPRWSEERGLVEESDAAYWTDPAAVEARNYVAGVELHVDDVIAPRAAVAARPELAGLEVLVQGQMGSPLFVSVDEAEVLLQMAGGEPAHLEVRTPIGGDGLRTGRGAGSRNERLVEILRAARKRADDAGVGYVQRQHVTTEELDFLADETLAFLRTRPNKPSYIDGWTTVAASKASVLPWWARVMGWSSAEQKQLRPLRTAVYDRLEERGQISKPPGHGTSIELSPRNTSATGALVDRIGTLVAAISRAAGIGASDYRAIANAPSPTLALSELLGASTASKTTVALAAQRRLDLSIERAALEWTDLPIDPGSLQTARGRLDYWRST